MKQKIAIILFLALALAFSLSSCKKETIVQPAQTCGKIVNGKAFIVDGHYYISVKVGPDTVNVHVDYAGTDLPTGTDYCW